MENTSLETKLESIQSFQSTIAKTEKALAQMRVKGANTALIEKRLKAFRIGLAILEHVWNQKPLRYTAEDLAEAREILNGVMPSVEKIYAKSKAGSPQKTLLQRRMTAMELAVKAIENFDK